jgi:hypothetical protein
MTSSSLRDAEARSVLGRRTFSELLVSASALLLGVGVSREAEAAVSILMSLGELVELSDRVIIGTAVEKKSQWEDLPSGKRIVTYTRVSVDEAMTGAGAESEVWVRTLGGVVDKIGQAVSGEASLAMNRPSLLFLTPDLGEGSMTARAVLGMAQGHYPIDDSGPEPKLAASPDAGKLLPRRGPTTPAREVLLGAPVSRARTEIVTTARRLGKALPKKAK